MTFNARRRQSAGAGFFFVHGGFRVSALLISGVCMLAVVPTVASQECDGLAEDNKALCQLMVACAAIDDADRREECFRVAANTVRDESLPHHDPEPATAPSETSTNAEKPGATVEARTPALREAFPDPSAAASGGAAREGTAARRHAPAANQNQRSSAVPEGRKKRWRDRLASVLRRDEGTVVAKQTQRTSFEIPNRFSATVTALHDSGRNRGLVALDGTLLFESNRAGDGNLRVGDQVRVVRASRLYGKRFQITGPSRRPFVADRIRCEREDITIATRRQCRLLDD